jgi:hypothetical protein
MRIISLLAVAVALVAGPALAGDPIDDSFHINFTGYLWAPAFHGTTGVRGFDVPVNASFADILENSDSLIGIEGRLGVSYGRFGAYVDGLWNKVGIDTVSGPFGFARIDPTLTLTYVEGALFYHAIDIQPDRSPDKQDYWSFGLGVDAYAGVRYTEVGLQLDFKNINQTESRNKGWVDPIVGARAFIDITDNWKLVLDSNFGGFGAASDFTYEGMGLVGYQFTMWHLPTTLWAGYKAIYDDYQSGSDNAFKWNMWVHGPIVGATVRFF